MIAMKPEVKQALKAVLQEAPDTGYCGYAKSYAKVALENPYTGEPMAGKELQTQLLHVLNNLQTWRGERAREVKAILKLQVKEAQNVHQKAL